MLDPNGGSIAKRTLKCRTYLGSGGSFYLSTSWSRQSAYTPVRKSHWFTQWNNQRSGGVSLWRIAVSKPVSLTLYAQWEEASHSFHFDTIYWIDDVIQWGFDRTVREGCSIGTLPTPSLDGFRFLGWWTKPDGMGYRVTSGMKAEDLEHISDGTVYAHWEKNPTVSFYSSDSLVATWSFAVGEPMGSLPTPPPPGPNYTIWTWIDEKGNRVTEETIFDGSFETLRASWMIPGTPIAPTNGG